MTRAAILLACLCALSGCESLAVAFVGANMATMIHADKTIPDIAISDQKQKDCSLLHASRNEPYCQDPPPDQTAILAELAGTRYCYRTLGGIDCYERPDFVASGLTQVDFTAGYLARPDGSAPMARKKVPSPAMAEAPAAAMIDTQPPDAVGPATTVPAEAAPAKAGAPAAANAPEPGAAATTAAPAPMALAPSKPRNPEPPHPDRAALAQVPPLAVEPGLGTY